YIDPMLINYLNMQNESTIYSTTNQLAHVAGMINKNYSTAFSNKRAFNRYISSDMGEDVNFTSIWDLFSDIKSSIKNAIRGSLNRIALEGLINYDETFLIFYKFNIRVPDYQEKIIIKQTEKNVLEEMDVSKKKLQFNDRLRNEYYNKINNSLSKELIDFENVFIGYEINIYREELSKYKYTVIDGNVLNEIFIKRTIRKLENKKNKIELKHPYIGEVDIRWDNFTKERLNDNYIRHAEYAIKIICLLKSKDVRKNIVKLLEK
ncbi:MAG TPA: hypothetical protein VIK86_00055, partial [Candidatus Paceibacterota bacterium]